MLDWNLVKMMGLRYVCSVASNVISILTFAAAIQAQISSAFIISLLSATSIMTAVVFYFKFGEKL